METRAARVASADRVHAQGAGRAAGQVVHGRPDVPERAARRQRRPAKLGRGPGTGGLGPGTGAAAVRQVL